jgi:SAM-dependent methyltransferase
VKPPASYRVTESSLDTALRYETVIGLLEERWRPDLEILEVGAGSAGITEFLRHRVTGVDKAFERTAERASPYLEQVEASADDLPFPDVSFDVVISLEMLEHVPPERREPSLGEMLRVLRPGGRLVVSFPADEMAARLDTWLNTRFRRVTGEDHPWAIEHIEHGVPATDEVVAVVRRLLDRGEVEVHRHMWAPSFRLVHRLYTIRRMAPITRLLGLHTPLAARGLFAVLRRVHREPAYRSIVVADKAASPALRRTSPTPTR